MKQWIFLVGAIISEVVATLSLKAGMDNSIFYIRLYVLHYYAHQRFVASATD